jgi:hypothetical protein
VGRIGPVVLGCGSRFRTADPRNPSCGEPMTI